MPNYFEKKKYCQIILRKKNIAKLFREKTKLPDFFEKKKYCQIVLRKKNIAKLERDQRYIICYLNLSTAETEALFLYKNIEKKTYHHFRIWHLF